MSENKIKDSDVQKLTRLAALNIKQEDYPAVKKGLGNIISLFASLSDVNTDDVQPLISPALVWKKELSNNNLSANNQQAATQNRADMVSDGGKAAEIVKNMPKSAGSEFGEEINCFTVPKVVD